MDSLYMSFGLPLCFLWGSFPLPLDVLEASSGMSYGFALDSLWIPYGSPIDLDFPYISYGFALEDFPYGLP